MMGKVSEKIAILGCGWLGLPLAERLLEEGSSINGSTTSPENLEKLSSLGIEAHLLKVLPQGISGDVIPFLQNVKTLIIDFPPGRSTQTASDYIRSMELLVEEIKNSGIKRILFVSSISVYEDRKDFPLYTEEEEPNSSTERGQALMAVEELLRSIDTIKVSILRLGGLIGGDRHPVYYLAGRKDIASPDAPVNLIHRGDCVGIIVEILRRGSFGELYNATFPYHPKKGEYYKLIAQERNLPLPEFSGESRGKIISSEKLLNQLEYRFTWSI